MREHLRSPTGVVCVLLLGALVSCSRSPEPPRVPLAEATRAADTSTAPAPESLSFAARAALDAGNIAFRAGRYAAALEKYRAAERAAPQSAAPYFGIFMAAQKLGRTALADSASREIARRASATGAALTDSAMREIHARSAAKR